MTLLRDCCVYCIICMYVYRRVYGSECLYSDVYEMETLLTVGTLEDTSLNKQVRH